MATEIRVPTLGESVTEATISQWFKKPGEAVAADEPVVELETDKVTVEVPVPASGVISEILAKEGETVGIGALLGSISADAAQAAGGGKPAAAGAKPATAGAKPAAQPAPRAQAAPADQAVPAAQAAP